mgnify:CR=1 FL=1
MTGLRLEHLTVRRSNVRVVDDISMSISPGEFVGLIGPNGAGKTTLMRAALGLLPFEGHSSLAVLPPNTRSRTAAWLPQERDVAWPVSVETLVALGRTPYLAGGRKLSAADRSAISQALSRMDLAAFSKRTATELSGGEKARALIARALAQEAPIILADEPVAGLDPAHQIAAMNVFRSLAGENRAVLVSLHDLGLASRYCDRLILLHQGKVVTDGGPREVLNDAIMHAVFNVGGHWSQTPDGAIFNAIEGAEA